jgi:hypothetical protein
VQIYIDATRCDEVCVMATFHEMTRVELQNGAGSFRGRQSVGVRGEVGRWPTEA